MTNKILRALLLLLAASQPSFSRAIPGPCETSVPDAVVEYRLRTDIGYGPPPQSYADCLDLTKRTLPVPVRGGSSKSSSGIRQRAGDVDSGQAYGSGQGYGSQQGYGGPAAEAPAPARGGDSADAPAQPPAGARPADSAPVPYTGKTIKSQGLTRELVAEGPTIQIAQDLVRNPANANSFKHYEVNAPWRGTVAEYQVNSREGIFVVEETQCIGTFKSREMLIANYVAEAGSPSTLRSVVSGSIVHPGTRTSIESALQIQDKEPNSNNVEKFEPDSPDWAELTNNPLVAGQLKMVEENAASFGNTRIKSISVHTTQRDFGSPGFDIVTDLGP